MKFYLVYSEQTGRHGRFGSSTTIIGLHISEDNAIEAVRVYEAEQEKTRRYVDRWTASYVEIENNVQLDVVITQVYE